MTDFNRLVRNIYLALALATCGIWVSTAIAVSIINDTSPFLFAFMTTFLMWICSIPSITQTEEHGKEKESE